MYLSKYVITLFSVFCLKFHGCRYGEINIKCYVARNMELDVECLLKESSPWRSLKSVINQHAAGLLEADAFPSENIEPFYLNEIADLKEEYKTWNDS